MFCGYELIVIKFWFVHGLSKILQINVEVLNRHGLSGRLKSTLQNQKKKSFHCVVL
jgi:hypothetical protein